MYVPNIYSSSAPEKLASSTQCHAIIESLPLQSIRKEGSSISKLTNEASSQTNPELASTSLNSTLSDLPPPFMSEGQVSFVSQPSPIPISSSQSYNPEDDGSDDSGGPSCHMGRILYSFWSSLLQLFRDSDFLMTLCFGCVVLAILIIWYYVASPSIEDICCEEAV